jgi:hypothetical protein
MSKEEKKSTSISLHPHGDGSYHTSSPARSGDGSYFGEDDKGRKEHESIGAALMHIAMQHGSEGDHMHVLSHDDGYTTHHVMEGKTVEGPHEHKTMRELKKHVSECMDCD